MLTPVFWVPVFTAIGYGLRYGAGWAAYSALLGGSLMSLAMLYSPYWHNIPAVAIGLISSMVVLPVYAVSLSTRLHLRRYEAEERASALERASRVDPLTGLANRAGYSRALQALLADARTGQAAAAVFYLDLDASSRSTTRRATTLVTSYCAR